MQCGHELGASRTCPSCGTTVPVEPLPAPQLPADGVRYPLFADEVDSVTVNTSGRVLMAPVESVGASASTPTETQVRLPSVPVVPPRRVPGTFWLALAAVVVVALLAGAWLLLHGGSSDSGRKDVPTPTAGAAGGADDVAATATASAPLTRAPGVDTAGNKTTYDASNMLDGDPTTAWEMPGDGTGKELTFTLAKRTHLTQVGLINGYAKASGQGAGRVDWYAGNRRILRVEWLFDDGTSVTQDLRQTTDVQTTAVHVTAKTVRLRLVEVTAPGKGAAARNMTPISEIALSGTAG
ncbi:hypothetical protein GCM10009798_21690 [Nocardioides panacihumi]|uniref:NAD glycohydrolase translocation F5/8 type C domain-containing protein n=1 Tax=Nocardioides panacihumi TaxID=400774 RepID=A0ABP5CHM7_9ACTN